MYLTKRKPRESGRDYALRTLRDNIIRLELEPGSMVSEKDLAERLGLSRGPVREALIELARVKIVEVYPQRGHIISLIDYELIDEARFMRETLECAVVERCCAKGLSPENLASLKENVKLQQFYKENLDKWNFHKLWRLDNEFHKGLFFIAKAMQIYALMHSLLVHFDRVRSMAITAVKEIRFVGEHQLILDAIEKGDSSVAKELMHQHLNRYKIDKNAIYEQYSKYINMQTFTKEDI